MNELEQKLGPEFGAMMDEYKDINLSSEQGPKWETFAIVRATLNTLNKLCGPEVNRPQEADYWICGYLCELPTDAN
jgi:hypothetical protein